VTDLRQRKTRTRLKVSAWEGHGKRQRQLVIELRPDRPAELLIRETGRRGYWVPFAAIYTTGARLKAEEDRKARESARKIRRRREPT
jgi:hypothetical protein